MPRRKHRKRRSLSRRVVCKSIKLKRRPPEPEWPRHFSISPNRGLKQSHGRGPRVDDQVTLFEARSWPDRAIVTRGRICEIRDSDANECPTPPWVLVNLKDGREFWVPQAELIGFNAKWEFHRRLPTAGMAS